MLNNVLLRSTMILAGFALVCVTLVAAIQNVTKPLIANNEHLALLQRLEVLVPAATVDNDMGTDVIKVQAPTLLGAKTSLVYRGRKHGQPEAAVINTVIPNGYAGPIKMLVAVRHDGVLEGVRVLSHSETPGLGDLIEEQKSDWIFGFNGKSLQNPPLAEWGVKRDNGAFDQLTGATITSRAVVKAVKNTLIFAGKQQLGLYANHNQHQQPITNH